MSPCPNCGHREETAPPSIEASRDLARVATAAEAGYLVQLLQGVGLKAEGRPVESFDAVLGTWTTNYLVAVDEQDAAEAARVLQAEAEEGFAETFSERLEAQNASPASGPTANPWRVLAVLAAIAAAGAAVSFDDVGRAPEVPQPQIEPASRLLEALAADPTPLRDEGIAGGARRRLRLDRATGFWELSIDADRDGRYETTRRFAGPPRGR